MRAGVELYMKYLKQGIKDAKTKAAQHAGIDYNEFGKAVRDAGLPEEVKEEVLNEDIRTEIIKPILIYLLYYIIPFVILIILLNFFTTIAAVFLVFHIRK